MTAYCLRGGTCEIAGFRANEYECNCVGGYVGIGNNVVIYASEWQVVGRYRKPLDWRCDKL